MAPSQEPICTVKSSNGVLSPRLMKSEGRLGRLSLFVYSVPATFAFHQSGRRPRGGGGASDCDREGASPRGSARAQCATGSRLRRSPAAPRPQRMLRRAVGPTSNPRRAARACFLVVQTRKLADCRSQLANPCADAGREKFFHEKARPRKACRGQDLLRAFSFPKESGNTISTHSQRGGTAFC